MRKLTILSSKKNTISLKTHENQEKTLRTAWEHFNVLRKKDRISEAWRHRVNQLWQCQKIIFVLSFIVIVSKL